MARLTEPQFDIITGVELSQAQAQRQPFRETMKQSTTIRPDVGNEELRAQLRTAQYELESLKQEREITEARQQEELREALSRAEADFKRAEAAENSLKTTFKKAEVVARERQELEDRATNERLKLEKDNRTLKNQTVSLRQELEEAKQDLSSQEREGKYAFSDLEQRHTALQSSVEEIQQDLSGKVAAMQTAQQKLARKEAEVGELENEVLRLKAQTGDADTLAIIKKELSEQVAYIKKLEMTNREQLAELKQFRKMTKSIEVVEEEKRGLEAKACMMDDLRKQLAESQLQQRILEDEKRSWTSYLETEAAGEGDLRYETPEQMAKAFLKERLERLSLVDKLGLMQPELSVKEENIRTLEDDKIRLQAELEQARATGNGVSASAPDNKAFARLQRQKNLVTKEVEYLRAQMKTFEAEEEEFTPDHIDEQHSKRIHELEDMVEQYRAELQNFQADLSKLESQQTSNPTPRKRSREDDEESNERLGELRRKTRVLQDELTNLQTRNSLLEAELKASTSQLTSLKETARTRVLELRDNPTAAAEAVKLTTLRTLREENSALLAQLEGKHPATKVVPISTLENVRLQLQESQTSISKLEKKELRLKQIWSSKALEFREAVCSILGWKLDFMPNGRVKATSILYPSNVGGEGEGEENSIVFDGENGTMKVSGGPQSVFAGEIKHAIDFWVEGRKEIPCFLAALTLEFYDRTTRAQH